VINVLTYNHPMSVSLRRLVIDRSRFHPEDNDAAPAVGRVIELLQGVSR
jgi:hypothetical protein